MVCRSFFPHFVHFDKKELLNFLECISWLTMLQRSNREFS